MTLKSAVRAGDLAATSRFLRAGADVNRRGSDGLPPLLPTAGLGQALVMDVLKTKVRK